MFGDALIRRTRPARSHGVFRRELQTTGPVPSLLNPDGPQRCAEPRPGQHRRFQESHAGGGRRPRPRRAGRKRSAAVEGRTGQVLTGVGTLTADRPTRLRVVRTAASNRPVRAIYRLESRAQGGAGVNLRYGECARLSLGTDCRTGSAGPPGAIAQNRGQAHAAGRALFPDRTDRPLTRPPRRVAGQAPREAGVRICRRAWRVTRGHARAQPRAPHQPPVNSARRTNDQVPTASSGHGVICGTRRSTLLRRPPAGDRPTAHSPDQRCPLRCSWRSGACTMKRQDGSRR